MQNNRAVKKVGRPVKPENEKKVQVINYIPKGNVKKFKTEIRPIVERFSKIK